MKISWSILSADGLLSRFCGGVVVDREILLLLLLTDGYTIVVVSIFHDGCGANRIYCFLSAGARSNRHLSASLPPLDSDRLT